MIEAATIRQIPYTHIYRKASQPDFYHLIARQRYGDKKYYPSKKKKKDRKKKNRD